MQVQRPPTKLVAGEIPITISFTAPRGQKLDDRWGDPTQLTISSTPENLLLAGEGRETGLSRQLKLNPEVTEGVLHVTARAAACDGEHGQPIQIQLPATYTSRTGHSVTIHRIPPMEPMTPWTWTCAAFTHRTQHTNPFGLD